MAAKCCFGVGRRRTSAQGLSADYFGFLSIASCYDGECRRRELSTTAEVVIRPDQFGPFVRLTLLVIELCCASLMEHLNS